MSKIGIDLDNVLNNLTKITLELYNKDSGDNLKISDIRTYKIDPYLKPEYTSKLKDYFQLASTMVKPIKGSQKYLEKLYSDGHEIYIVTSSYFCDMHIKYNWIKKNYPFISKKNVWVVHDKQMLKLDYLLDDCLDNLYLSGYKKILFDYPWNQLDVKTEMVLGIERVSGWEEFYRIIKKDLLENKVEF